MSQLSIKQKKCRFKNRFTQKDEGMVMTYILSRTSLILVLMVHISSIGSMSNDFGNFVNFLTYFVSLPTARLKKIYMCKTLRIGSRAHVGM